MTLFKLAVEIGTFGKPFREALADAAKLAVHGVQLDAVGELAPASLGATARREIRTLLRSYNLEAAAINCPLRQGLDESTDLEGRLNRIREAMQLAYDLGANRVVLPLPKIQKEATVPVAITARDAITNLGQHGDRIGTLVGLEVGLDSGETVRDYLNSFDLGSLGVTFDPANLLLNGFDPMTSLAHLAGKVVYCHARDARRATVSGGAREAIVGAGDIEWMLMLATLESIGFQGYLCLQREPVTTRVQDIAAGVTYLRKFLPAV